MSENNNSMDNISLSRGIARRKPPPTISTDTWDEDIDSSTPYTYNVDSPMLLNNNGPSIPPRPQHKRSSNSIIMEQSHTFSFSDSHVLEDVALAHNATVNSHDDNEVSFEGSFTSVDSPKPMGPKDLLGYNSTVATPTKKYRERRFQHLSVSSSQKSPTFNSNNHSNFNTSPSNIPPYPLDEIELDIQIVDDDYESDGSDGDYRNTYTPTKGNSNSPLQYSPNSRTNEIISQQSTVPPTEIPSLSPSNAYSLSTTTRKPIPIVKQPSKEYISNHSRVQNYILSQDDFDDRRENNDNYDGWYSPALPNDRSPSLMYDPFNNNEYSLKEAPENNGIVYSNLAESPSKWTDYSGRSDPSDVNTFEEDITPTTSYFDYSVLPELPSFPNAGAEKASAKGLTLNSALSFKKEQPTSTQPIRRKRNESLPPIPLDLPNLPFSSSTLGNQHFSNCSNVWSISSVFQWCLMIKTWTKDSFISKRELKKALIKLLVYHKSDIPLQIIGRNADQLILSLINSGAIIILEKHVEKDVQKDEVEKDEHIIFSDSEKEVSLNQDAEVSGVLTELLGCFCFDNDHNTKNNSLQLRCYSNDCSLNRIANHEEIMKNMNPLDVVLGDDWASHWKLTAEDLDNFQPNTAKRQSLIFDLLRYEQTFMERAKCFIEFVGPAFISAIRDIVDPSEIVLINSFEEDVIEPCKELLKIHQEIVFEPLIKILLSEGIIIKGVGEISNIYYSWAKGVKNALLRYIATIPMIENLLKNENVKIWVDNEVRNMPRVKELKVNGPLLFISTFNSRYQSLPLQLSDIRKYYDTQDYEYVSLTKSIKAIKNLGAKANDIKKSADNTYLLKQVQQQLIWKSNTNQPNLNLRSENRKLFYRGDLLRKGDLKINSNTNHVIILDNYVLITEKVKTLKLSYSYKVIENPIPIELILFEEKEVSMDFKPITKNLATVSNQLGDGENSEPEPSSFPFKVRYAGRGKHNAYTFSTRTEKERKEWLHYLSLARSNLCKRLKSHEPFSISSISNTCFAYDYGQKVNKLQLCVPFDPLEEVATDSLNKLKLLKLDGDIYNIHRSNSRLIYATTYCSCSFKFRGSEFILMATSSGVFCSNMDNRWRKVIPDSSISKMVADTQNGILIILSNKHLRYYSLDLIIGLFLERKKGITSVTISDAANSFTFGKHRNIPMLFYAKRKTGLSTTNFKVLIPETDNNGIFNAFRCCKKFYIQAECFGISIFNKSFAVHTNKGFEILELDKLLPRPIPEVPYSDKKIDVFNRKTASPGQIGVDLIKRSILTSNVRPIGMFKLTNNSEFILIYNDCAVFTNKHGKLSRISMLKFGIKTKSIAFKNNVLFLVCDEAIEIWSISNEVKGSNKIIQVVTGKDISMLEETNDGIYFSVANPKVPGMQLILMLHAK